MDSPSPQSRPDVSAGDAAHILHLYTQIVDKYAIQGAFLASLRNDEEVVYITEDNPKTGIEEFSFANAKLRIVRLEDLRDTKIETGKKRIVVDAGSFSKKERAYEIEQREIYLNELAERHSVNCLCTYDVSKISPETIKHLVRYHNQLRLTTSDLTVVSGDIVDKSKLSGGSVERIVKENLDTLILALLQKKPMCGSDIIEAIHLEFSVFLSPGTIYPLLHSLQERRLIRSEKQGKAKIYAPAQEAELKIRDLINEQIQVRKLLNRYLSQEMERGG